jgi:hypothetical protein
MSVVVRGGNEREQIGRERRKEGGGGGGFYTGVSRLQNLTKWDYMNQKAFH